MPESIRALERCFEFESLDAKGRTEILAGLLFAVTMFIAPVLGAIPAAATAPALVIVGAPMLAHAGEIE